VNADAGQWLGQMLPPLFSFFKLTIVAGLVKNSTKPERHEASDRGSKKACNRERGRFFCFFPHKKTLSVYQITLSGQRV